MERVGPGCRIVGIDLIPSEHLPGAIFVRGDFTLPEMHRRILEALEEDHIDVILSDMSPNRSGMSYRDSQAIAELDTAALDFARAHLRHGGHFLCKVLGGEDGYKGVLAACRQWFDVVRRVTPQACRAESQEHYLVGLHYRGARGNVSAQEIKNASLSGRKERRQTPDPSTLLRGERYSLDSWPGFTRRRL